MIVRCKAIYNENSREYRKFDPNMNLVIGFHYNVLELLLENDGVYYRINSDRSGLESCSIIVNEKSLEIVLNSIPKNWVLNKSHYCLSPEKWADENLWEESFWQDYNENKSAAMECYRDEIKKIVSIDKEFIQIMIDERSDRNIFRAWQDTMLPLFDEVLNGKLVYI